MKIPDAGDNVYITDIDSEYYGCCGKVFSRREGKTYNYCCEYDYVIVLIDWKQCEITLHLNDLQIGFSPPMPKADVLKARQFDRNKQAIRRIAEEIGYLTKEQQQAALAQFLWQAVDARIDAAEVIKNIFKQNG